MTGIVSSFEMGAPLRGFIPSVRNKVVCALSTSNFWSSTENNSNNTWNVNFSSGNVNNNNKNNSNVGRAVAALTEEEKQSWIEAYDDCCRNKKSSQQCSLYRIIHEEDLFRLAAEVKLRIYEPGYSDTFIVKYPKLREIFAANFRDRIVQHWITLRIEPLLEKLFVETGDVSYNCRKGYGTLRAIRQLEKDIEKVSNGYTKEAWIGKFDIHSFFMSIDISILWKHYEPFIKENYEQPDIDTLLYLSKITIFHRPQDKCIKKGDLSLWDYYPQHKSLFHTPFGFGMAAGNITTQLLANFLMNQFDKYALSYVNTYQGTYIRFVDDFCICLQDKHKIIEFQSLAKQWLTDNLNLTLHPDKHYIQPVTRGVKFVGSVIKPNRTYLSNRTVSKFINMLHDAEITCYKIIHGVQTFENIYNLDHFVQSMNSYAGFLKHHFTYAIRRKRYGILTFFWQCCYIEHDFLNARVYKQYDLYNFNIERNERKLQSNYACK